MVHKQTKVHHATHHWPATMVSRCSLQSLLETVILFQCSNFWFTCTNHQVFILKRSIRLFLLEILSVNCIEKLTKELNTHFVGNVGREWTQTQNRIYSGEYDEWIQKNQHHEQTLHHFEWIQSNVVVNLDRGKWKWFEFSELLFTFVIIWPLGTRIGQWE